MLPQQLQSGMPKKISAAGLWFVIFAVCGCATFAPIQTESRCHYLILFSTQQI
jgi:hypothetical protein